MENNPNMCDSLFVPQRCVLFASKIGQMVRDNRKLFLHKGSYHKFRGYAYASLNKLGNRTTAMETEAKTPRNIKDILSKINPSDLKYLQEEKLKRKI